MVSAPFRRLWRFVAQIFPEREITILDRPGGTVHSYHQTSFWRFTKFCLILGFSFWASWSSYVYVYHRPLLQKRTAQMEEIKAKHARQLSDLNGYMKKFNNLVSNLNMTDDKILNAKKTGTI